MYPIVVDEHGAIIDGHHRAAIAGELGIDYQTQVVSDLNDDEKFLLALRLNIARRHLTDGQKVVLGQQIEERVARESKRRMLATQNNIAAAEIRSHDQLNIAARKPETDLTRSQVAREVGIGSGITYQRHKQVIEQAREEASTH